MSGRILIVDDVATNRIVYKVKLGAACYEPLLAADGATCLARARTDQPDLILLDMILPDMTGTQVLHALRADPKTAAIPVVVLTSDTDPEQRMQALAAGADDFLAKSVDDITLLARLRNLLRGREAISGLDHGGTALQAFGFAERADVFAGPCVVALVTMRPETGLMWRRDLGREIPDRLVLMTREEALAETPIGPTPDVFVIEADLQGPMGGLRLMSELRSRQPTRNAAICILQAGHAPEVTALAFDMGANDLLPATISARELGLRLTRMIKGKRAADQVRASVRDGLRMALIDPLTGLHNRRYALGQLTAIAEDAQKRGAPFAVMVLDLDRFKQVNDLHGHPAGDSVLIEVARRLAANLRVTDLLARIGGEEFLIVLPDSDLALARQIAERLCKSIEERRFSLPDRIDLSLTASIGLAIRDSDRTGAQRFQPEDVNEVIDRADKALLVAKTAGRNRVNISQTAA